MSAFMKTSGYSQSKCHGMWRCRTCDVIQIKTATGNEKKKSGSSMFSLLPKMQPS